MFNKYGQKAHLQVGLSRSWFDLLLILSYLILLLILILHFYFKRFKTWHLDRSESTDGCRLCARGLAMKIQKVPESTGFSLALDALESWQNYRRIGTKFKSLAFTAIAVQLTKGNTLHNFGWGQWRLITSTLACRLILTWKTSLSWLFTILYSF